MSEVLLLFNTENCCLNDSAKQPHNSRDDGFMAIKLDTSKAYDKVEWPFLKSVMRRMGFKEKWISLVMTCVTTVSYSILINGEPKGMIRPSRGIKQGNPLSPFLFLLCIEVLYGLISQATRQGDIRGFSLCRNGPRLTHLFAKDSLLFCKSSHQECQKVLDILDVYSSCSGKR